MSRNIIRTHLTERLYQAKLNRRGCRISFDEVCALLPPDEPEQDADLSKPLPEVHIRWLIRRDLPSVLSVDNQCYPGEWERWSEEDFLSYLRQRNCIGMVCESESSIVGFMVYELHKDLLRVQKMAVEVTNQRRGIATAMVRRLQDKLSMQRRRFIDISVNEDNLTACMFLRSCGFVATPDGDRIDFRYELDKELV